jgi:hypothetical protein
MTLIRIKNDTVETRLRADGKIDVYGADDSGAMIWLATFIDDNLAGVFVEATWAWNYSEVDVP